MLLMAGGEHHKPQCLQNTTLYPKACSQITPFHLTDKIGGTMNTLVVTYASFDHILPFAYRRWSWSSVNSAPLKFSELGAECMNLIQVKNTWMCVIVQFFVVGLFTVNSVISVVSTETRNYPFMKHQRRYRCMCRQAECIAKTGE